MNSVAKLTSLLYLLAVCVADPKKIGLNAFCDKESCLCTGKPGTPEAKFQACFQGNFCYDQAGEPACGQAIYHLKSCGTDGSCPCLGGNPSAPSLRAVCGPNQKCIAVGGTGYCSSTDLVPNQQCGLEKCTCGDEESAKKAGNTQSALATCKKSQWCVKTQEGPKCAEKVLRNLEVAKDATTPCVAGKAGAVKPGICKVGATCTLDQNGDPICNRRLISPGQKCDAASPVPCSCDGLDSKKTPITQDFPPGSYCLLSTGNSPQVITSKEISAENSPCDVPEGCMCLFPSSPASQYHFILNKEVCKAPTPKPIKRGVVCPQGQLCECAIPDVTKKPICVGGQVCFGQEKTAFCAFAPSISEEYCLHDLCGCRHEQLIGDYCLRGEFCAGEPGKCFPKFELPFSKEKVTQEHLCARSVEDLNSRKFDVCLKGDLCREDSVTGEIGCVHEELEEGGSYSSGAPFLCTGGAFANSARRPSVICRPVDGFKECGLREEKPACARLTIPENSKCPLQQACLCRLKLKGDNSDLAAVCLGDEVCIRNEQNLPICSKSALTVDGQKCEKGGCPCVAFDPNFPKTWTEAPPICNAGQYCLRRYGEPVCANLLTDKNPQATGDQPNSSVFGTACATMREKGLPLTLRCPSEMVCGLYGNLLQCASGKDRSLMTPEFTCTNLGLGCECQDLKHSRASPVNCGPLQKCVYKSQELECQDVKETSFYCPKKFKCYCGPMATRIDTKDQYCQIGGTNKYVDDNPKGLMERKNFYKHVDDQVKEIKKYRQFDRRLALAKGKTGIVRAEKLLIL